MSESEDRQKELKEFRDEILGSLENKDIKLIQLQLARIVSHLESEQGTLVRAVAMIQKHERILHGDDMNEENPGLLYNVRTLVENERRKRKVNYTILGVTLTVLAVEIGKLLFR